MMFVEALILSSLYAGMWWVLPKLATVYGCVKSDLENGTWAETCRISFKIKGACNRFRMGMEARKVPGVIVDHMLASCPITRSNFKAGVIAPLKRASETFKYARNIPMWSLTMTDMLMLANWSGHLNIFVFVQCGCILMHHGMGDTWVFRMMEIQMDILFQSFCRSCIYSANVQKVTFRGMIKEILSQPQSFKRFLFSYKCIRSQEKELLSMIPQYQTVLFMLDFRCSFHQMVACFNRMPNCILASVAYLKMMSCAHSPCYVVASTRRFCRGFEAYLHRNDNACVSGKWKVVLRQSPIEVVDFYEVIEYDEM